MTQLLAHMCIYTRQQRPLVAEAGTTKMSAQTGPDAAGMQGTAIREDMRYLNRDRAEIFWRSLCGAME